jgi:hypothetical protein
VTRDPHALHPLRAVADALGVAHRRVRSWADAGTLDTLQPARNAERLVSTAELRRFERLGYRVNWDALAPACAVGAVSGVSHDLQ